MANCKNRLPLYPKVIRKSQSRDFKADESSQVKNRSETVGQNTGQKSLGKILNDSMSKLSHGKQSSSNADILLQTLLN